LIVVVDDLNFALILLLDLICLIDDYDIDELI